MLLLLLFSSYACIVHAFYGVMLLPALQRGQEASYREG
jgi:hypothetical protein